MNTYVFDPPYNHWYGIKHLPKRRFKMYYCGIVATESDLPTNGMYTGDVYVTNNDHSLYMWDDDEWNQLDLNFVHKTKDETVAGAKVFVEGPYGTTATIDDSIIDLNNGCVFTKTITANTTFSIIGVPTGKTAVFNLILTNGGSKTVTWPNSVKWANGTAPSFTSSGVDVITFMTPDGGITWYGTLAIGNAS